MLTTYDQEIRSDCTYGLKVIDDHGKWRTTATGKGVERLYSDPNVDVESWHLPTCPCGRGAELPDWAK